MKFDGRCNISGKSFEVPCFLSFETAEGEMSLPCGGGSGGAEGRGRGEGIFHQACLFWRLEYGEEFPVPLSSSDCFADLEDGRWQSELGVAVRRGA